MSSIIRFFVAADDEAAEAQVDGGPDADHESVTYGNFDADLALLEWDSLLTGRSFDDVLAASASAVIADEDDGAQVVAASVELQQALSRASAAELDRAARQWAADRAAEGEPIDPELATEILGAVGRLARTEEQRLYCWIS
jgi:hypothetical protein